MKYQLYHGDCLEVMKQIPDGSVDMILADLPYGTTACKWDVVIPFEPLWTQYKRIINKKGCIALFGSEPFSSYLRMSNIKNFKYDWIWDKCKGGNPLLAKIQPIKIHEIISIFGIGKIKYNPIMTPREKIKYRGKNKGKVSLTTKNCFSENKLYTHLYPKSIIQFSNANQKNKIHPTQKPVSVLEYLIKTYTDENDIVLDNTMGSGSTGVAAMNTGRKFIGIELEKQYYDIAEKRIKEVSGKHKMKCDKCGEYKSGWECDCQKQ